MKDRRLEDLVQDASRGSQPALEEPFDRHLPDLRAFFRMRVGPSIRSRESDTDLVQSVCREVLQEMPQVGPLDSESFRRWLFATANRKLVDKQRFYGRAKRCAEAETPGVDVGDCKSYVDLLSPSTIAMSREASDRFERAFDELSEEQRIVVTNFKLLGMSHAQIGAAIGKGEGAVRMILHRALARIGRLLEDNADS